MAEGVAASGPTAAPDRVHARESDRPDAATTLDACKGAGRMVSHWSGKHQYPPVQNVEFGDGEMTGTLTCGYCQQHVPVSRKWIRGARRIADWYYAPHDRGDAA